MFVLRANLFIEGRDNSYVSNTEDCHIGSFDVNSFSFIRYIIRQKEIGCTHTPYFFLSSNALWKNISDRHIIILYIFLIFVNSFRLIMPTNFVLKTLAFSVIFFAIVKLCHNNTMFFICKKSGLKSMLCWPSVNNINELFALCETVCC